MDILPFVLHLQLFAPHLPFFEPQLQPFLPRPWHHLEWKKWIKNIFLLDLRTMHTVICQSSAATTWGKHLIDFEKGTNLSIKTEYWSWIDYQKVRKRQMSTLLLPYSPIFSIMWEKIVFALQYKRLRNSNL